MTRGHSAHDSVHYDLTQGAGILAPVLARFDAVVAAWQGGGGQRPRPASLGLSGNAASRTDLATLT